MAIADTVWGRLVRFNAPRGSHGVKGSAAAVCSVLLRIAKSLGRGTRSAAIWAAPHLVMVALWICLALVYAARGLGYATYHTAVWLYRALVYAARGLGYATYHTTMWLYRALVYAARGAGDATYHAAVWSAPRAVAVIATTTLATFWLTVKTVILAARSVRGFFRILPQIATPMRLAV